MVDKFKRILSIAKKDVLKLEQAEKSYGTSWRKRGGVGAFMMLARKWDRIEQQVHIQEYDIFKAYAEDKRAEGVLDDIQDLRRYLLLVEEHITKGG
jgi:hypothetical protein|tara:strand:- start:7275 stop:7562 length:288 start_codon:yes stop_codon:yes gene_type:complete